jgi:hypothetical protein
MDENPPLEILKKALGEDFTYKAFTAVLVVLPSLEVNVIK